MNSNTIPQPGEKIQSTGTVYLTDNEDEWHIPTYVELTVPQIIDLINFDFMKKQLSFVSL